MNGQTNKKSTQLVFTGHMDALPDAHNIKAF